MKRIFTTAALVLSFGISYGQQFEPGYIGTIQGDTTKGIISNRGESKNSLTCLFKPAEDATVTEFNPKQLQAYVFTNGKKYEVWRANVVKPQLDAVGKFQEVPVVGQPVENFMQVLVKGKASLYALMDVTGQNHYYFQKDSNSVQEIFHLKASVIDPATGIRKMHSTRQYIGVFNYAFSDCPSLQPQIQKTKFKESELIALVAAYNKCVNPEKSVFTYIRPKQKVYWGAMLGLNYAKMNIIANGLALEKGNYQSDPEITGGLFLDLPLSRLNKKLTLHNGLLYLQRNFYDKYDVAGDYNYYYDNYEVNFDLQYIQLKTLLRYSLPMGTYKPFFTAGLSHGYLLKHEQSRLQTHYFVNQEPQQYAIENNFVGIRKFERGYVGGIGVQRLLPAGQKLTLEARFERSNGFTSGGSISSNTSNFTIIAGFGL